MTLKRFEMNRKDFNEDVLKQTYKYQKIYGFDMTKKENSYSNTHNNEADAFKHAFMQAYASLSWFRLGAKAAGDYHEFVEGHKDPKNERNMDLWNNSIGREISDNIRKTYGAINVQKMPIEELCEIAANQVVKRMKNGELITNPDDKRNFKNMLYDRLQDKDRIFYEGEYWDELDDDERKRYSEHYANYKNSVKGKFPTKAELITKTLMGDYIYVHNYTRGDGTKVSGYYRRRVIY